MRFRSTLTVLLTLQLCSTGLGQKPSPQLRQAPPPIPQSKTQTPPGDDDDVVRITTNLVQVDPVVTDGKGKPVTDLRPEEVEILEDGKPQQITNFSYVSLDAPLALAVKPKPDKNAPPAPPIRLRPDQVRRTIALVVDDLGLSFESTYYIRRALKKFLDEQMQPDDLVAIIRTGGGIGALQQFTTDKRQLYAAIDKVKYYMNGRGGISAFAPIEADRISMADGTSINRTALEDSDIGQFKNDLFSVGTLGAVRYVVNGLRDLPGRKSVVLMSDGFPLFSGSERTGNLRVLEALGTLTEAANRASVVIYTLDARGLQTLGYQAADNTSGLQPGQIESVLSQRRSDFFDSQAALSYLARQTGGVAIQNTNDLSSGLRKALEDQGGYYLIGYRPDQGTFDANSGKRKFHKLSLKINRPGKFNVRMRNGFYGVTDEEAKPRNAPMNRFLAALTSPFGSSGINVQLTSLYANDPKMGSIMRSLLHVDANDLKFKEEADGWHTATFDILAYTFGDNGTVVDRMGRQHTMRVKGKTYERILKDGFTYHITVPVKKAGAYQLRTALRDESTGEVGSATQFIEVPDIKKNRLTLSGLILNGISQQVYENGTQKLTTPGDNSDDVNAVADPQAGPAIRKFKSGTVLLYGYQIYNARLEKGTQRPQLLTQVRLFRNGKELFTGKEIPFDAGQQTDLKRLVANGAVQLGSEMQPGEYVFQIIVTDLLASGKQRVSSQWIDFDVVS
jgi:VWFA-related protein